MTNGQQRPANPNRISIFKAREFRDGRPPTSEFSVNIFLTIDMLFELMDALQNGVVQPEDGYHGVQGVTLWGNGYRGTGEKAPIITGTINTHKAIWQAKQRQQQADPIYPGQPVNTGISPGQAAAAAALQRSAEQLVGQQQVAPAYAAAFPPQQPAAAPVAPPPAVPAPTPAPRPHPLPGGQWSTAPVPAAPGWKSAAPQPMGAAQATPGSAEWAANQQDDGIPY